MVTSHPSSSAGIKDRTKSLAMGAALPGRRQPGGPGSVLTLPTLRNTLGSIACANNKQGQGPGVGHSERGNRWNRSDTPEGAGAHWCTSVPERDFASVWYLTLLLAATLRGGVP